MFTVNAWGVTGLHPCPDTPTQIYRAETCMAICHGFFENAILNIKRKKQRMGYILG